MYFYRLAYKQNLRKKKQDFVTYDINFLRSYILTICIYCNLIFDSYARSKREQVL